MPTFLCVAYLLGRPPGQDLDVQQQSAEGLEHRVGLAHLHLEEVGVVAVCYGGGKRLKFKRALQDIAKMRLNTHRTFKNVHT